MYKPTDDKKISSRIFDGFNLIFMLFFSFAILYPLWYTFIYAINEGKDSMLGGLYWLPRKFTPENFQAVLRDSSIMTSFLVTAAKTLIGTSLAVFVTAMYAFILTKKNLIFRKVYMTAGMITLFFGGGLIPTFLVIKRLGLVDNFLVFILPSLMWFYYSIIFMSFFRGIPDALEESAKIDGANDLLIFLRIILPLSKPAIATIALFIGVWHWNDYFTGVIYITRKQYLLPIQTFLYKMIAQSDISQMGGSASIIEETFKTTTSKSLQMATMFVTTTPIIIIYPLLQKYFVKGMLIGAVKG